MSEIRLSWKDNSDNEGGFEIERSDNVRNDFRKVGEVGAGVTTFIDLNVPLGQRYYYRVRAFNGAGFSAYSNVTIKALRADIRAPGSLRSR